MFATLIRLVQEYKKQAPRQVTRRSIRMTTQGMHYDLKIRLQFVLDHYLPEKPIETPAITWFGSRIREATRRRLLGAYFPNEHKIKIHRILDQQDIPEFFVDYVIYHEVLHALHPPTKKRGEKRKIHHSTFRSVEKQFPLYKEVKEWEKLNKHRLLTISE
jgi:hypothetical protein